MALADSQAFEALHARVRDDAALRFAVPGRVDDLEAITLARLAPQDAVRSALPAVWRERMEREALAVNPEPHRIGGIPTSSQGYARELQQSGEILLLQLQADPWMLWRFGDAGEWSFFAPPGPAGPDLSAAHAVFEMG
jgi:hypothetical protein